jgi:Ca-activated chloride channel family protein
MTIEHSDFNELNNPRDPRNDPRWTAYVLDEMDPVERTRFEKEIESIPEAEEILAEIRETIGLVGDAVPSGSLQLTAGQRYRIDSAIPSPVGGVSRWKWTAAAGIAAVVVAGFVTITVPERFTSHDGATVAQVTPSDETPGIGSAQPTLLNGNLAPEDAARSSSSGESGGDDRIEVTERPEAASSTPEAGSAALSGMISDTTGALIPGVDVTFVQESTDTEAVVRTNDAGVFRFADLPEGDAEIRAEMPGFQTVVAENLRLRNDAETRFNVQMEPYNTATEVEVRVSGEALALSSAASVGQTIGAEPGDSDSLRIAPGGGPGTGGALDQVAIVRDGLPVSARRGFVAGSPPPPAAFAGEVRASRAYAAYARLVDAFGDRTQFNTEEYGRISDNPFLTVADEPLATFSADVDTASYANVRRFLTQRTLPPPDAVRIEEMVNYFTYDYEAPTDGAPVRVNAEVAAAPWNSDHRLVRIGIQGEQIDWEERAPTNLVFLIDVSGSMDSPDKLPLLREGMKLLVEQLGENDRVAIVVYAGNSGLVLPSTTGDRQQQIIRALDRLQAGGSTNGGAGIQLAYDTAVANFIEGGVNRVILATDGDFNIGVTNNGELTRLIEEKAESGVFLSVLGFGTGNLNDAGMEALADRGNGNYGYIDSIREARKVLVEQMGGTLITIAKDVKFQVEFNPAEVAAYRLIGYENRLLENQDFNDDTKDAGEIGAGLTVTALFEVVGVGVDPGTPGVDPLRYQAAPATTDLARSSGELLTVKVRYKEPDEDTSLLIDTPVRDAGRTFDEATADFRFASSVAAFGMILRDSPHKGDATFDSVLDVAEDSRGADPEGYRDEFVDLVRRARAISDLDRGPEPEPRTPAERPGDLR